MKIKKKTLLNLLIKDIPVVIGLVLIWRGIWYVLDAIDKYLLGESHIITSILGIVLGLVILYIPDKNLKEIEKL